MMPGEPRYTGLEIEAAIRRLLDSAPHETGYCVLCLAEHLQVSSAQGYLDIANALRRVGIYHAAQYQACQAKCPTHTGHSGRGTLWTIRKR